MNEEIKNYILEKYGKESLLFLICCNFNIPYEIDERLFLLLVKDNLIEKDYIKQTINLKIPLFKDYSEDSNIDIFKKLEEVKEKIDTYRSLFKGIRTKSIGDKKTCIDKITRWLINNSEYSFEDIVEAAEYYVSNTELKFISNADNFIYNYDANGNEYSTLSIVLETIKMGTIQKNFN